MLLINDFKHFFFLNISSDRSTTSSITYNNHVVDKIIEINVRILIKKSSSLMDYNNFRLNSGNNQRINIDHHVLNMF